MSGGEVTLQGRDAELALLRGALDGALAGRGRLAFVTGEAGIGKSALAAAIAQEAQVRGAVVTWGRAWEYADAPPYFPVWPCLRALAIEHDRSKGSEAEAFHLWEDVLAKIAALPTETPHVWVLEDLHAADLQTLDLLTFLAQPIRGAALLVIATSRAQDPRLTDRMKQRMTRMAREGLDVRLEALADLDVAALAEQTIGRALPAAAVKRLVEITRGNPLFIVECARALEGAGGSSSTLPHTVRQVVLERVALLDEATRDALSCGAILGREFAAASVARMREALPARIIDSLLPALRAGIIAELKPGRFQFSHTLVCEAIEDSISPSARATLHARAAAALASLGDGTEILVERARHALLSLAPGDEPVALAERAAQLLEREGAFDRALAMHERIEEARRATASPPAAPSKRLHVASVAEAAGKHAECRRICDDVIAAARAAGDADLFASAVLLVGKALKPGIVDRALVGLLEEARTMLGGRSPSLDSRLLARLAAALQPANDPEGPNQMAREAIAEARSLGDEAVLLEVLETAGSALVDFAPVEERVATWTEMLARATKAGDRPRMLRAYLRLVVDRLILGDAEGFDRDVDSMIAVADEIGHPRYRWRALLAASMRAVTLGHFSESDRYVVEVAQLAALTDDPALPLSLVSHELLRARIQRRDVEARALAETAPKMVEGMPHSDVFAALIRGAAFARMDDEGATRAEVARLGSGYPFFERDLTGRDLAAEAYAVAGSDEQRRRIRDVIAPFADLESVSSHIAYTHDGPTAFYVARVEASLGAHARAEELLRGALARVTARRHLPWIAQIGYELGKLMTTVGRADEARRLFTDSLAIAADLPMPGLVSALHERMAGGASSSAATDDRPSPPKRLPLSLVREGDVWRVAEGERSVLVRDTRGMQLLSRLVERADEEIHVLVLASDEGASVLETSAGEQLDERARREYKARLAELDEDLAEAERDADAGRVEKLRRETELLRAELARAVGLGGKARHAGSSTERARVNVQRRIKDALARVIDADEAIGRSFERAVKTGTFCCFRP